MTLEEQARKLDSDINERIQESEQGGPMFVGTHRIALMYRALGDAYECGWLEGRAQGRADLMKVIK